MNKQTSTPSQIHRLQQTIYENLPVGMELYDGDGYLIEINSVGLNKICWESISLRIRIFRWR